MAGTGRVLGEEVRPLNITEQELKDDIAEWLDVVVDEHPWEEGWFTAHEFAELLGTTYGNAYDKLMERVRNGTCEKAKTRPRHKYRPKDEDLRNKLIALHRARLA